MKKLCWSLLVLSWFLAVSACAQDMYKAFTIPGPLRQNAHAVVRLSEKSFTVKSPGEAVEKQHIIITILDSQGDVHASLSVPYDKLSKVTDIEGVLYDGSGKVVKKLKKTDVSDYSASDGVSLYNDNRLKTAQFPKQLMYPYTVEFTYEITTRNLMFYPKWIPQDSEHLAVEKAQFVVDMPKGIGLRYKEFNLKKPVSINEQTGNLVTYTWAISDVPAIELEPFSPPIYEILPLVFTAPTEFEVQDYKGSIRSWNDLSTFYYSLNKDRDAIPDELRQRMVLLTADEKSVAGKVAKIYAFLQSQTRYVGIQLGIGGWQTIEANKVAATNYGDCKALTNYTKAMLKAVGIPAYEALIKAGDDAVDIVADFPSFQFNHVMLCVPDGRDTLWLECTSQHNSLGYLGTFTGNRHALLILPDGGKLIRTPIYKPIDNRQHRRILVQVSEQGEATAEARTNYSGFQQERYEDALHGLNEADQRSWVLKTVNVPTFELKNYSLTQQKGRIPVVTENLSLQVRRWATPSGARLFLPLNLMSALSPISPATAPRQSALHLGTDYDFEDTDTITYQLPNGYIPEFTLEPQTITSKFGDYTARVAVEGDKVSYIRRVTMHQGRYPAEAYTEWIDFRKKIAKADKAQMVFVKKP